MDDNKLKEVERMLVDAAKEKPGTESGETGAELFYVRLGDSASLPDVLSAFAGMRR